MPMQQNIFSFILDKLSVFSVKGLMLFGFYLHRDIKYCRKVIHRCTFTSYSLHQLYWLWFALGFVIKRKKINKQATHHRLSILALEIAIYNGVVSL